MLNLRTDLAMESNEMYKSNKPDSDIKGIKSKTEEKNDILITTIEILDKEASEALNKPIGKYITLESNTISCLDPTVCESISYILSDCLKEFLKNKNLNNILIVGLGNNDITPDALGPEVISNIMITKHIKEKMPQYIDEDIKSVCAVSPGVLGTTGIETSDIIKGITEYIKPSLILAIDALAASNPKRICSSIQITDTGICPGSGVGNKRKGLNINTLGCPVIAIGVPTVVDSKSLCIDYLENTCKDSSEKGKIFSCIKSSSSYEKFMVTPKEIDSLISHIAKIISNGINLSVHKGIDIDYIENFTY